MGQNDFEIRLDWSLFQSKIRVDRIPHKIWTFRTDWSLPFGEIWVPFYAIFTPQRLYKELRKRYAFHFGPPMISKDAYSPFSSLEHHSLHA